MKKFVRCSLLMVIVGLAGGQPVAAQDGGFGSFLDWINKLSGPRMVGLAGTGWLKVSDDFRVRGSIARRRSSDTDAAVTPRGNQITMWSFQPSLEYQILAPLAVGAGFAVHRFSGDADTFTHLSFPVYAQSRLPLGGRLHAVALVGTQIFSAFDATDFAPLAVTVSRNSTEFVLWASIGLEVVFP